jgi:hypothetical protein
MQHGTHGTHTTRHVSYLFELAEGDVVCVGLLSLFIVQVRSQILVAIVLLLDLKVVVEIER